MTTKLDSEARRRIILDGYDNNEPLKNIAAKIGCSLASLKVTASKLGCTRTPKEAAEFRRGFQIPENKLQDYYRLMIAGQYKSRECAIILGLIIEQSSVSK
ncbi:MULTISPECIES: hypothetical protein [unclassified Mesorhizobium]|uniref:hypothetical protein n=1 Tax=unclassified Mesorhizobium TaxID=325217 RepID=UPI0012EB4ADB|nr:hypothetical protein [Mesorhizobium sp. WSM3626]